jgi:hypothetical protein
VALSQWCQLSHSSGSRRASRSRRIASLPKLAASLVTETPLVLVAAMNTNTNAFAQSGSLALENEIINLYIDTTTMLKRNSRHRDSLEATSHTNKHPKRLCAIPESLDELESMSSSLQEYTSRVFAIPESLDELEAMMGDDIKPAYPSMDSLSTDVSYMDRSLERRQNDGSDCNFDQLHVDRRENLILDHWPDSTIERSNSRRFQKQYQMPSSTSPASTKSSQSWMNLEEKEEKKSTIARLLSRFTKS